MVSTAPTLNRYPTTCHAVQCQCHACHALHSQNVQPPHRYVLTIHTPGNMDAFDADLEQLQKLFMGMVAALRKEREELCDAHQHFEMVCLCLATFGNKVCIHILLRVWGCVEQERQRVAASNIRQSEIIKVDVGGNLFHVSRSTLTAQRDCLLDSLFSGRFRIDTQADSSVFIDRYVNVKAELHLSITSCVAYSTQHP